MNTEMSLDETIGVEAIKYLNSTIGHTEPQWVTLKTWRFLNDFERKYVIETARRTKELEEQNAARIADILGNAGAHVSDSGDSPISESPSGDLQDNQSLGEAGGSDTSNNPETPDDTMDSTVAVG